MRNIWFTADFHFGHFNIIRYCNRPFGNTQEMDDVVIERMNAFAKPNWSAWLALYQCVSYSLVQSKPGTPLATARFMRANPDPSSGLSELTVDKS